MAAPPGRLLIIIAIIGSPFLLRSQPQTTQLSRDETVSRCCSLYLVSSIASGIVMGHQWRRRKDRTGENWCGEAYPPGRSKAAIPEPWLSCRFMQTTSWRRACVFRVQRMITKERRRGIHSFTGETRFPGRDPASAAERDSYVLSAAMLVSAHGSKVSCLEREGYSASACL